ncbi:MAG: CRISPR-associated helicase Cas3' [Clostridiaceae bacterium]|nr:CRISPR-associated helicase Cas3' [Clostridiaceae bacterium]
MEYFAHTHEEKSQWQPLKDHLQAVANLAREFGDSFDAGKLAYIAGLLHDIGKYSKEFQQRLHGSNIRVDHSTAGAQEAIKLYGKFGKIFSYVIAGHHSGLPDIGSKANESSLEGRLNKKELYNYDAYKQEIIQLPSFEQKDICLELTRDTLNFAFAFFIRMIYSCVVDADFLDTENAMAKNRALIRGGHPEISELYEVFELEMDKKLKKAKKTAINQYRTQILEQCLGKANSNIGMFSLTVPTGGGKTLSSLAFALQHALKNRLKRIIYVIPYTSIIEQNAKVFKEVLGESCVLEHHSNFQFKDSEDETFTNMKQKLLLSAENWDIPIVVTTNVQFFESLFSNRSSRCRKLHNLSRSVIILDEAQMLPTQYLKPCLAALEELVRNYKTSIVLSTATQPELAKFLKIPIVEIIEQAELLYEKFRRVEVHNIGSYNDEQLASEILQKKQALCIVNSRKHAQLLYENIKGSLEAFHLSARMCPVHRTIKLNIIRERLSNRQPCKVISTQLIEAGVDIDFPIVYRSLTGIDSIAQAAGRCNREGLIKYGQVYVFKSTEKHGKTQGWLNRTAEVAEMVMKDQIDILSLEAVKSYFKILYDIEGDGLDQKGILKSFQELDYDLSFPFAEVAEKFKIIENTMVSIIIPYDDRCMELLERIKYDPYPLSLQRDLQPYTVSVYQYEFMELLQARVIESLYGVFHILSDMTYYDDDVGLLMIQDRSYTNEILIFE